MRNFASKIILPTITVLCKIWYDHHATANVLGKLQLSSITTKLQTFGILYSKKVWLGESLVNLANCPWFAKLKPSKLVPTINNLLAGVLIHQTFFHQMLKKSQSAERYLHQTFPLSATQYRNYLPIEDLRYHYIHSYHC